MSRYQVAQEQVEAVPHQLLEVGSLKWGDSPIPVCTQADNWDLDTMLGKATDFRRNEDGVVSAEIEFKNPGFEAELRPIEKDVGFTIWANDLIERKEGEFCRIIISGNIKQVFLTPGVPWTAEVIPEDEVL